MAVLTSPAHSAPVTRGGAPLTSRESMNLTNQYRSQSQTSSLPAKDLMGRTGHINNATSMEATAKRFWFTFPSPLLKRTPPTCCPNTQCRCCPEICEVSTQESGIMPSLLSAMIYVSITVLQKHLNHAHGRASSE